MRVQADWRLGLGAGVVFGSHTGRNPSCCSAGRHSSGCERATYCFFIPQCVHARWQPSNADVNRSCLGTGLSTAGAFLLPSRQHATKLQRCRCCASRGCGFRASSSSVGRSYPGMSAPAHSRPVPAPAHRSRWHMFLYAARQLLPLPRLALCSIQGYILIMHAARVGLLL